MIRRRFLQVDVFTSVPFGGNPLAVFADGQGLRAEEMQQIAREMNLSETTFVLPPRAQTAAFRVRIFTPEAEIPFAGHPVVGTAFALVHEEKITFRPPSTVVSLELGVGVLPVELAGRKRVEFVWMTQKLPVFGEVWHDLPRLGEALGIPFQEIAATRLPVQVVSSGLPFLLVPVTSRRVVEESQPNPGLLLRLLDEAGGEGVFVFTHEVVQPSATIHARMFAPPVGVLEDPATGSASGAVGAYLLRYGVVSPRRARSLVIEQGLEMKRPSLIHVQVANRRGEISGIRVGGEVVLVMEGELFF